MCLRKEASVVSEQAEQGFRELLEAIATAAPTGDKLRHDRAEIRLFSLPRCFSVVLETARCALFTQRRHKLPCSNGHTLSISVWLCARMWRLVCAYDDS